MKVKVRDEQLHLLPHGRAGLGSGSGSGSGLGSGLGLGSGPGSSICSPTEELTAFASADCEEAALEGGELSS